MEHCLNRNPETLKENAKNSKNDDALELLTAWLPYAMPTDHHRKKYH